MTAYKTFLGVGKDGWIRLAIVTSGLVFFLGIALLVSLTSLEGIERWLSPVFVIAAAMVAIVVLAIIYKDMRSVTRDLIEDKNELLDHVRSHYPVEGDVKIGCKWLGYSFYLLNATFSVGGVEKVVAKSGGRFYEIRLSWQQSVG